MLLAGHFAHGSSAMDTISRASCRHYTVHHSGRDSDAWWNWIHGWRAEIRYGPRKQEAR